MDIQELKRLSQAAYARFAEIDKRQYDSVRHVNTMPYSTMCDKACRDVGVPEEWHNVVALIIDGSSYYSRCQDWFR